MKLLFKQRVFSWLDSYDIFDEEGVVAYRVKGELSWGHKLAIYDAFGERIGEVKQEVFTLLPKFYMYVHDEEIGMIQKEFSFFRPKFHLTCNDWIVQGDLMEWEYDVKSPTGTILHATKEIFHFGDTYVLDINRDEDALYCLMIVLAIDAAKCAENT